MNEFEKMVRIALVESEMTMTELAAKVEMSQPNFSKKLSKNNFHETDMRKIAEALGKKLVIRLED